MKADYDIVSFESSQEINCSHETYDSWSPLSSHARIYPRSGIGLKRGYQALNGSGHAVGVAGIRYEDGNYAGIVSRVDPRFRQEPIERELLIALISEIPSLNLVCHASTETDRGRLLESAGFVRQDRGDEVSYLHELSRGPAQALLPNGFEISTVHRIPILDDDDVVGLERTWCIDRDQPVGPRLIEDYEGPDEGFTVMAKDEAGRVVGLANAELTWTEGLGTSEFLVVDTAIRRMGIGTAFEGSPITQRTGVWMDEIALERSGYRSPRRDA